MKRTLIIVSFIIFSSYAFNQAKSEFKTVVINKNESIIEKPLPPLLFASDIEFKDENQNNRIDANETCSITFKLSNKGKGTARNVTALLKNTNVTTTGLQISKQLNLGSIVPNTSQNFVIPVASSLDLTNGIANFQILFNETMGLAPDPIALNIETKAFDNPILEVVDYSFLSDNGSIKLGVPVQLKTLIQNKGQGIAENVKLTFVYPDKVVANGDEFFQIGTLNAGESKTFVFDFIITKNYSLSTLDISVDLNEKYNKFSNDKTVSVQINGKSAATTTINIASSQKDKVVEIKEVSLTADVDKNIPLIAVKNPNKYAIIIGNEDYSSRQSGLSSESNVAFAVNDAKTFMKYAEQTFGVEEKNIYYLENATSGEMNQKITLVCQILQKLNGNGELVFYYAGHGYPNEITKSPYLMPVDVNATNLNNAINLFELYKKITDSKPKKATVFLDACFSGGGRDQGLLAARAVKVKPKTEVINGNIVIFTATSEEQSALPYKDKQHGMFTYYLLKEIQLQNGLVNYEQLFKKIYQNIGIESLKVNQKTQDPQVLYGYDVSESWKQWKIND